MTASQLETARISEAARSRKRYRTIEGHGRGDNQFDALLAQGDDGGNIFSRNLW